MQPRIFSTLLLAICVISLMYLSSRGIVFAMLFFQEKAVQATKDITENVLKNISKNFHSKSECSPISPTFCRPGKGSDCVAPFEAFMTKYRVAPKYSLTACVIEKSMSTVLAGLLCYLYDPEGFKKDNRSIASDLYHNRFCKNKNEYSSLKEATKQLGENMSLFTVVRDPVERFISGFADKCVLEKPRFKGPRCYGCEGNFSCFAEKQYSRMMAYVSGRSRGVGYEDIHFNPQTWYCSFRNRFDDFQIVKYRSGKEGNLMLNEILGILKKAGVEEGHVEAVKNDITGSNTPHSTKDSSTRKDLDRQIRADPYVMRLLVKMFYYDFVFFGFELPVIKD